MVCSWPLNSLRCCLEARTVEARCPCKAWPADLPPTDDLGFALNATNFEEIIKDWATSPGRCMDSLGVACGSFWVYDLDDLEDCVPCLA